MAQIIEWKSCERVRVFRSQGHFPAGKHEAAPPWGSGWFNTPTTTVDWRTAPAAHQAESDGVKTVSCRSLCSLLWSLNHGPSWSVSRGLDRPWLTHVDPGYRQQNFEAYKRWKLEACLQRRLLYVPVLTMHRLLSRKVHIIVP